MKKETEAKPVHKSRTSSINTDPGHSPGTLRLLHIDEVRMRKRNGFFEVHKCFREHVEFTIETT